MSGPYFHGAWLGAHSPRHADPESFVLELLLAYTPGRSYCLFLLVSVYMTLADLGVVRLMGSRPHSLAPAIAVGGTQNGTFPGGGDRSKVPIEQGSLPR